MSCNDMKQKSKEQKGLNHNEMGQKSIEQKNRNREEEKKGRIALTILVTACVVLTMLIAAGTAFFVASHFLIHDMIPSVIPNTPKYKSALIFMLIITMIVGIVLAAFLTRNLLIYVNRIINRMNQLASGDYSARLSYGKPICLHPTVIEIMSSFNRMAEELEKTEMLRTDFINNFSHEFKTPIVSIAGFAKMLKKENLSEEQRKEYLDIIEEEAKRLADMATNVLKVTKIENQIILTDISKFNLSEQIRSSVLLLEEKWIRKNLEFDLEFGEYEIYANEELLKEVWINLLHNAVKFSPENEEISVQMEEKNEKYCITISNKGEEIAEENQKKLFQKFYQTDESHATEGYGVGLAVVKRVVELHKGKVHVECKEEKVSFIVELPKVNSSFVSV